MALTFDIWAIGSNGEQMTAMLEGVSSLMYGASGTTLTNYMRNFAGISFMVGFVTVVLTGAFRTGNILGILKWFGSVIAITVFFFSMPVDCKVHDTLVESSGMVAPAWYTPVPNVPVGLAMPLSMITIIEKELTELIDKNFTAMVIPWSFTGDSRFLAMSRGGLGTAASALLTLNQMSAGDPRNVINGTTFVKECLAPAVSMEVISASTLANSTDLIQTIEDQALLVNFFASYSNADGSISVYNCSTFWGRLRPDFNAADSLRTNQYANSGFITVGDTSVADTLLAGVAKSTINYTSGVDQLRANAMFYRLTDQGIGEAMGYDPGAMQVLSEKTREFQANQRSYGMMSFLWLPKIKTVLLAIWCGMFVMLIPFILMNNFGVLKGWLGGFVWLSLWGPLMAIINAIYMNQMLDVFASMSLSGLTYGNRFTVWQEATDVLTGIGIACSWVLPVSGMIAGWLGIKAPQSTAVERGLQGAISGAGAATASYGGLRRLAESGDQAQVHNDYDRATAGKPTAADRAAFMGSMANSMGTATAFNMYGFGPGQTGAVKQGQGAAGIRGEYNQFNRQLGLAGNDQRVTTAGALGAWKANSDDVKVGMGEAVNAEAKKIDSQAVSKQQQADEKLSASIKTAKDHGFHSADDSSITNSIGANMSTNDATDMAKRVQATEALSRHLQDTFKMGEAQAHKVANTVAREGSASVGVNGSLGFSTPGKIASASVFGSLQETSSNRDAASDEKNKQLAAEITKSMSSANGVDVAKHLSRMHSESMGQRADSSSSRSVSSKEAYASTLGAALDMVTGISKAEALRQESSQFKSLSRSLKEDVGLDQTAQALGYFASGKYDGKHRDINSEAGMTSALNEFREMLNNKDGRAQFTEKFLKATNPGLEKAMGDNFVSVQHHEVKPGTSGRFSPESVAEAKNAMLGSQAGDKVIGAFQGIRGIYARAASMSVDSLNSIVQGMKDGNLTQGQLEGRLREMNPGNNQNTIDRQKELVNELAASEKALTTKGFTDAFPANRSVGSALNLIGGQDPSPKIPGSFEAVQNQLFPGHSSSSTGIAGDVKGGAQVAGGYDNYKTQSGIDTINNQLSSLQSRGLASQEETASIYRKLQEGVSGLSAGGREAALAAGPEMVMNQGEGWQNFVRQNSLEVTSSASTLGSGFGSAGGDGSRLGEVEMEGTQNTGPANAQGFQPPTPGTGRDGKHSSGRKEAGKTEDLRPNGGGSSGSGAKPPR